MSLTYLKMYLSISYAKDMLFWEGHFSHRGKSDDF